MYLNVYVPVLQAVEGVLKFSRIHRGHTVASTSMVESITRRFVESIERYVQENGSPRSRSRKVSVKTISLLRKWLRLLPHPFSAKDRQAGYRYQLSILQIEFSLTQVLDRPVSGRIFFEEVIRENLDIGRPSQVSLVFDR